MKRFFFVAGESSGDMHGANLIRELLRAQPTLECEGLGGRRMEQAGMTLRHDLAGKAIMGFVEVLRSFPYIRRIFTETVGHLTQNPPDAIVFIDYPGFNMRLAKRIQALGIPAIYYISPQVWAWHKERVPTLARLVKKMLVILPFEEELYTAAGLDCAYVGHPLLDHMDSVEIHDEFEGPCVIGLLPGSREQEIKRILGTMLEVAEGIRKNHKEARFVAPCVDEERAAQIRASAGDFPLEVVVGETYQLLHGARFCMVASGTATLETTLFRAPMVVLYRVAPLTYWMAKRIVDIDHIAMVNILAGRRIVPEFIQHEARPETILPIALELIEDSPRRKQMIEDLTEVCNRLGGPGASQRAAQEILAVIEGKSGE